MRLIRLSRKDTDCWGHLLAVTRSIETAAVHFGQKSIAGTIDRIVATFFTDGHPDVPLDQQNRLAVWYVVDEAGTVRGHLLALLDQWDGEPCVLVSQLWAPHIDLDLQKMAAEELDQYAKSRGCKDLFMYTRRPSKTFWQDRFGFKPHRMLYRRRLEP